MGGGDEEVPDTAIGDQAQKLVCAIYRRHG